MCVLEMFYTTEVAQSEQKHIPKTDCSKVIVTTCEVAGLVVDTVTLTTCEVVGLAVDSHTDHL